MEHVFIDRLPGQMTESASLANALLVRLMLKAFCPFKFISSARDTITVDETAAHNTVSFDRAAPDFYHA